MVTIYSAIFIFFVLSIFIKGHKGYNNKAYLNVCFAIIFLLHIFFNPYYSDNYFYNNALSEYKLMSLSDVLFNNAPSLKAETGYRIFCKLVTYVSSEWTFFIIIVSLIMLGGYYQIVYRYSSIFWLSILLIMTGPFIPSLFVLRQHMAMGLILFSIPFILKKQLIPYLLICIVAISIHQTAAVFVPTYFLYNFQKTKMVYMLLTIIFIVLYYYFSFFLNLSASLVMETSGYDDYYLEYNSTAGANYKMALLMFSILALRVIILKKHFYEEGINKLCSILLIVGTIISISGIGYIATSRLNMYYTSSAFLFVPNTFSYIPKKLLRYFACLGYFLFTLYFLVKNAQSANLEDFWFFYK